MIYYTSDLHLGNSNIIKYEHRPWKTVEEMDAGLIGNWNQVVGRDDDVYVLGDFCFAGATKAIQYLECLNGHKHLIRGNHDKFMRQQKFKDYVLAKEHDYFFATPRSHLWQHAPLIKDDGYYKHMNDGELEVILCHFPILYWDGMDDRGTIHLYGHMHSRPGMQHPHPDAYNVGVDVNNYRPVTLAQLMAKNKVV